MPEWLEPVLSPILNGLLWLFWLVFDLLKDLWWWFFSLTPDVLLIEWRYGLASLGLLFVLPILARVFIRWPLWLLRRVSSAKLLLFFSPFGGARWASRRDLRREGLLKRGGLFLGQWRKWFFRRADLFYHGEGHFLTIAAPGGGKSSAAVIPTLLTCRTGSFIVTDPKGELTAITRRHRESLGRVVYLNPFYRDFEKATGLVYPDSGFNPFDAITDGDNVRAQADNFARLLCVTDREASGSYFQDEGAELLSLFITWLVRHDEPENRNLPYLYQLVRTKPRQIFEFMEQAQDPILMDDANRFRDMFKDSPAQWAGAISKAQLATKRYVPTTPLAVHTERGDFDPRSLKTDDVTVFILLPSEHVQTAAPWLNLVIGLLGEAVGRAGEARPVTFLLDELPALGYLPDLRTQMRQYRSSGLRMWLFSQTTAALSDRDMYGAEGFKDLAGLCDTKQFFSIREEAVAKEISMICGETTRTNRNLNAKDDSGVSTVGVPLVRPEDVLKLKKGRQLIIRGGMPPIKAWLVPYYTRNKWRKLADKNPYRK